MLFVNDEPVSEDLVEETFSTLKAEAERKAQMPCCLRDPEFREQAEKEVVDSILVTQEAEKRYPKISEEQVKPELKRVIDYYREQGVGWEILEQKRDRMRAEITATLRMEKLILSLIDEDEEVSPEEIENFYQENLFDYTEPAQISCLHLMKSYEGREGTALNELYKKVCGLREEALKGGDFYELSMRVSDGNCDDIELGWIPFQRPTNVFETVIFSLSVGEVSPVICYEKAYHLVKVMEQQDSEMIPLEEVRSEIEERILTGRKRKALENLSSELRKEANIEHRDE